MTPMKLAARALIAGVAVSAMSLIAASPASAHTNNVFTYFDFDRESEVALAPGFGTLDRTNGALTALPTAATVDVFEIIGAEVFNEVGTAIGVGPLVELYSQFLIIPWDHSTGAEQPPVPAYVAGADGIQTMSGLDTLADGTLITYVEWVITPSNEFPVPFTSSAIATVNPVTGQLTPVINLTSLTVTNEFGLEFKSIATDPISGVTYGFLESDNVGPDLSFFVTLDIAGATHGPLTQFEGVGFENGFIEGADFDADGTLYFIYGNNGIEQYELSTLGAPSGWPTAERHVNAIAASNYLGDYPLNTLALTLEYTPILAETGAEFPALVLAASGVAVLAGTVTVVASKRRKNGAVV